AACRDVFRNLHTYPGFIKFFLQYIDGFGPHAAEFGDVCSHDIRPLDHTFGASDNQHKHQYDNEFRPANPQNIHTSNSPSIFSARSWRIVSASDASLPSTPLTNPIEDSALNT